MFGVGDGGLDGSSHGGLRARSLGHPFISVYFNVRLPEVLAFRYLHFITTILDPIETMSRKTKVVLVTGCSEGGIGFSL